MKSRYDKRARAERPEQYYAKRRRTRRAETQRRVHLRRAEWLGRGDVTYEQLQRLWKDSKGLCRYCGEIVKSKCFTPLRPRGFDHVVPRARGGVHTLANIVVSCHRCNSRKSDTLLAAAEGRHA